MKTLKTALAFLLLVSSALITKSQSILTDAKGDPLFVVPTSQTSIKFNAKVIGFDLPLSTMGTTQFYVYPGNDTTKAKVYTMIMSRSWYTGLSFIENSKNVLNFSGKQNLSPAFELGFNRTLEKLQNPALKKGIFYTYSAAFFAKYQHLKVYDKTTKMTLSEEQSRISPGFKTSLNLYRGDRYAFAFNGSWQKMIETDELSTFQKVTDSYYADGNVASNGQIDGYFAPVNPIAQFRFSAAWSYYGIRAFNLRDNSPFSFLNKVQLAFTPYYFLTTERFEKTAHYAGMGFSIMPSRVFEAAAAKFSDALTLSYNLVNSSDKKHANFFFISGTFSFGDIKNAKYAPKADRAR
ncbi:hypothetical protein D9M68_520590 [compost metagenome]